MECPRVVLPADAYFSTTWFDREQSMVTASTWHRGSSGPNRATWEGLDFFSKRPHETFDQALADLPSGMGSFRPSQLHEIAAVDIEGNFNWKLFIENHVDVLHLWYLHVETLGGFDHSQFSHQQFGSNWASYEPARNGDAMAAATPIRHIDRRDRDGLGAHLLFPDTPMASASGFFATYRARPVAADRTVIELRVLGEPDADARPLVEDITAFIREDISACERIQDVVRSRHFEVGPLASSHEAPVVTFQKNLLKLMTGAPS